MNRWLPCMFTQNPRGYVVAHTTESTRTHFAHSVGQASSFSLLLRSPFSGHQQHLLQHRVLATIIYPHVTPQLPPPVICLPQLFPLPPILLRHLAPPVPPGFHSVVRSSGRSSRLPSGERRLLEASPPRFAGIGSERTCGRTACRASS